MFQVKVIRRFKDKNTGRYHEPGEILTVDLQRFRELTDQTTNKVKLVELIYIEKKYKKTKGPKIIIAQGHLYYIGGIETFLYNFCKHYKDRNITVVCQSYDLEQVIKISNYANILIDDGSKLSCDILIVGNYDGVERYVNHISSKKVYQMIHADLYELNRSVGILSNGTWMKSPKVNKVITVSKTAADGLKKVGGGDSEIIYNILEDNIQENEGLIFITLSRATREKGVHRMIEMAKRMKAAGRHFIWFICCSLEQITDYELLQQIKSIPEFVIVPPNTYNKQLIRGCDYLVQLSDTESFCYSAFEALQREVPVILTDFPEAFNIIKEGENGYIVKRDLSNLDIDKIFNHKPSKVIYEDKCDYNKWEKVFRGEL